MAYVYRMVELYPELNQAASYLEKIVNEHAKQGWEFYRVDTIGTAHNPGCLASLLGAKKVAEEN